MESSADQSHQPRRNSFLRDYATVSAGYIAGHGVLRSFAGILTGLDDKPRATLIERWIPLWNALGFFLAAWGAYHFFLWLGRWSNANTPVTLSTLRQSHPLEGSGDDAPRANAAVSAAPIEWKSQLKALQKRKDVGAILDPKRRW